MRHFTFRLTLEIFVKYPDALRPAPWRRYITTGELKPGKIRKQIIAATEPEIPVRRPG